MKDEDEPLSKMALTSTDGPSEEDTSILQVRSSEVDFMATAVLETTCGCVPDVVDVTGPASSEHTPAIGHSSSIDVLCWFSP